MQYIQNDIFTLGNDFWLFLKFRKSYLVSSELSNITANSSHFKIKMISLEIVVFVVPVCVQAVYMHVYPHESVYFSLLNWKMKIPLSPT